MPLSWSTDQVWSIIKSYEETCRALREIESEITALQQKQSELEFQRSSQHAMLVKLSQPAKERVFSSFDVLQQIFTYAIEPAMYDAAEDFIYVHASPQVLPTVFSLASVSSLWRNTALRSPTLWQRIGFAGGCDLSPAHSTCIFHRVECCIRRSFPLPLIIRWEDFDVSRKKTEPCCWAKSLFEVVAFHSHRWQAAKLNLPFEYYKSIFPLNMPKLEALAFGNVAENPRDLKLGSMPSLRTLGLMDYGDFEIALPWDQLTTISASQCITMVDSPLKNCKRLERLYVEAGVGGFAFQVPNPISLAEMWYLSICSEPADIPWSNLTMPALECLTMDHRYPFHQQPDDLHRFLERCPRLHLLQIRLCSLESNFTSLEAEALLNPFSSPTVRTLQLTLPWPCKHIQPLLSFLTVHQLMKQFPALHHIHISLGELRLTQSPSGAEDAVVQAIFALSHDIERHYSTCNAQLPLQMVHLHTISPHDDILSQNYLTSPHLRVTSTPLEFERDGEVHFPFNLSDM
ncbi:hypothetical protein DL96DRAFT_1820310 [Flagelloscypha sp. PMI_526]|nr:hypothetical protein DL96DRAFT_1820310 [Flagelloscypha sp. PMI_526]